MLNSRDGQDPTPNANNVLSAAMVSIVQMYNAVMSREYDMREGFLRSCGVTPENAGEYEVEIDGMITHNGRMIVRKRESDDA